MMLARPPKPTRPVLSRPVLVDRAPIREVLAREMRAVDVLAKMAMKKPS